MELVPAGQQHSLTPFFKRKQARLRVNWQGSVESSSTALMTP
jgi:hypothetical protein